MLAEVRSSASVPWWLAVGRCVEVWAPVGSFDEYGPKIATHIRYRRARDVWLRRNGFNPMDHRALPAQLRRVGSAWSFRELEASDPERLVERLTTAGLPDDWRPVRAPKAWRDLPAPGFDRSSSTDLEGGDV